MPPTLAQRLATRDRPDKSPVMYQKWRDLLFLHWEFDAELIQRTLPAGLQVDTFEDKAYLGIVPFFMKDVHPRFLPSVPGISDFQELNVRTYVYDKDGRPGVWFYSLDANQWLAVKTARATFNLPYFYADMHAETEPESNMIDYTCHRHGVDDAMTSRYKYRAAGQLPQPEPGSLEFFLVERYLLFAHSNWTDKIYCGQVHHIPYPVFAADVAEYDDIPLQLDGFTKTNRKPDHVLMSTGVDVDILALKTIE